MPKKWYVKVKKKIKITAPFKDFGNVPTLPLYIHTWRIVWLLGYQVTKLPGITLLGNDFNEITHFYNMETVMKAIFSKTTVLPLPGNHLAIALPGNYHPRITWS